MEHGNVHRSGELNAAAVLRLLERCDALRRPQRFDELLLACECDARGRLGKEAEPYPQRERLATALRAAGGGQRADRRGGGGARPRARRSATRCARARVAAIAAAL